jgi:hypothetical protein
MSSYNCILHDFLKISAADIDTNVKYTIWHLFKMHKNVSTSGRPAWIRVNNSKILTSLCRNGFVDFQYNPEKRFRTCKWVIWRVGNIPKHANRIRKGIGGTSMRVWRTECNMENYVGWGEGAGDPIMSLHGDGQQQWIRTVYCRLIRSDANEDKHRRFDGL